MPWPILAAILAAAESGAEAVGTAAATAGEALGSAASSAAGALGVSGGTAAGTTGATASGLGAGAGPATAAGALGASGPATLADALPGAAATSSVPTGPSLASALGSLAHGNVGPIVSKGLNALDAPQGLQDFFNNTSLSVSPGGGGGNTQQNGELPQPMGAPQPLRKNTVQSVFRRSAS